MKNNYIDSADMEKLLAEVLATPDETNQGRLVNEYYKIAAGVSNRFRLNPDDRDEIIQNCVMLMLAIGGNFEPGRAKLFNYMTTCCFNRVRQEIKMRKSQGRFFLQNREEWESE